MIERLARRVQPGPFIARMDAALGRRLPPGLSLDEHHRARVLVVLVAVFNVAMMFSTPIDAVNHAWGAVAIQIGWGAIVDLLLVQALKRGRIAAMGHFVSGILVVNLTLIAQEKGGLVSTEIAWQCAAILFATLVVGPRGAFLWTLVAMSLLALHVYTFDPTQWHGRTIALSHPADFATDVGVLYLATWGLAYAFDRARATFFRRLEQRNLEMRRVLDHASDALLVIDREGRIGAERSARAEKLLEGTASGLAPAAPATGAFLWDVLATEPENAEPSEWIRMTWEAIIDDIMPREVTLAAFPRRITFRGRAIDLSLTPIDEDATLRGALVVLHDVTEALARERAEQAQRETVALFEHVRVDPSSIADFVREMDRLVESAARSGTDGAMIMRDIHTIKGTSGLFGLESLVSLCHAIEDRCARAEISTPTAADRDLLAARWSELGAELREWSGTLHGSSQVSVGRDQLSMLRSAIAAGTSGAALSAIVADWDLTPIERHLARLAHQGEALAARLEKDVDFHVEVEPRGLRVDTDVVGPLLSSLVHAVRNAIDHGIADPGTRAEQDKPPRGRIVLRACEDARSLVVEVVDDGEGIAWEVVRRKAEARGLPAATEDDLVKAILDDGFSTRDEATTTSGRGVGLAAIQQAALQLGGTLTITSEPGKGSRFQVRLPVERLRLEGTPSPSDSRHAA